jgi:hypothetical protein
MMFDKIQHIGYLVADLDKAVEWFKQGFGAANAGGGPVQSSRAVPGGGRNAFVHFGQVEAEIIEPGDISNIPKDSMLNLSFVPLHSPEASNVYIDTCWFQSPVQVAGQTSLLYVRINNHSPNAIESGRLTLKINDEIKAIGAIDLYESKGATAFAARARRLTAQWASPALSLNQTQPGPVQRNVDPRLDFTAEIFRGRDHHIISGAAGQEPRVHAFLRVVDIIGDFDPALFFEFGDGAGTDEIGPIVDEEAFFLRARARRNPDKCAHRDQQHFCDLKHPVSLPSRDGLQTLQPPGIGDPGVGDGRSLHRGRARHSARA